MSNTLSTQPPSDENFENENFAELFEKSIAVEKTVGSIIKGIVILIERDVVILDLGLKTEGKISIKEFQNDAEHTDADGNITLKKGDEVEIYLDRLENAQGQSMISREKAIRQKAWELLKSKYKEGDVVEGNIFGRVKGGFTVNIENVIAFLPGSQVDVRQTKDITPLMHAKQKLQILKIDDKQGNVVVSRRALLEESRAAARNETLSTIKEGMTMEGVVKNITDYGAFIDLGNVDGLLHVTDISWSRISHPSEILTLGQTIKVVVIKFNQSTKRISLGMKQLNGNPWEGVAKRLPKGKILMGTVTNITDYGAFVEVEQGIEGLVHLSEISWAKNKNHTNPSKQLTIGQEVKVMILDVDEEKHRISLGMKQCEENPWMKFAEKNPINSIVEGEVKNTVDFGLFLGFEGGVDGLVHISDLSWDKNGEEVLKDYKVGTMVKAKILNVEPEKERISLGIKQLNDSNDKAEQILQNYNKGDRVTCVVESVSNDGIKVIIDEVVNSFIKRNELASDRIDQKPERFATGDKVDAQVTGKGKSGTLSLSIKALEIAEQKEAIDNYGSTDSGASLGDILGQALNNSNNSSDTK